MAGRPEKFNADYFSHVSGMRNDDRIKALRRKYSHTGYSVWNMLLETLCHAKHFKHPYDDLSIELMAGDFDLEPEMIKEIIDYLIKIKLIVLEGGYIFSKKMIDDFKPLLIKRESDRLKLQDARNEESGIVGNDNTNNGNTRDNTDTDKAHSIEEYRKAKENLFNEFWKHYDKPKDKEKCHKKWMSLTDTEINKIAKTLQFYIRDTPELKYRKNPLTYLNGKVWIDYENISTTQLQQLRVQL
jgi:uncharacterized protein YxeA